MRRLRDVGEFGFIEMISGWIGAGEDPRVILGPGDDGAVLRPPPGRDLVVSTAIQEFQGLSVRKNPRLTSPRMV